MTSMLAAFVEGALIPAGHTHFRPHPRAYAARAAERAERARKLAIVEELVSRRNPTQRDADKRLFMSTLSDELDREHFRQHGWRSGLNANAIFAFWEELEPDAFQTETPA